MSIHPIGSPLQGPFLRPKRMIIGQEICSQIIPQGEIPLFYREYYAGGARKEFVANRATK